MSYLPRFQVLPFLVATALGGAACTDSDDPPKLVSVNNQTDLAHTVSFGATAFGSVPAGTVTGYEEVADGINIVLVDGRERMREELGSDNVGGEWTLYLQGEGDLFAVGVALDD